PAVGGAAVVLDLEGERGVAGAVGVGRRAELERTSGDKGKRVELAGGNRHAVVGQTAGARQGGDLDRQQRIGAGRAGGVGRVGKAEIGRREGVGAVLQHRHRVVGAGRGVVDRGHVDGQRVGRLVEVDPAVGGAAVVLDLEGERGVAGAVGVGRRAELELSGGDIGGRDELAGGNRHAVVGQTAGARQGGDLDRQQRIGAGRAGGVGRVGKAEIGRRDGVVAYTTLFRSVVGAGRGVVDRGHVDGQRVGRL